MNVVFRLAMHGFFSGRGEVFFFGLIRMGCSLPLQSGGLNRGPRPECELLWVVEGDRLPGYRFPCSCGVSLSVLRSSSVSVFVALLPANA